MSQKQDVRVPGGDEGPSACSPCHLAVPPAGAPARRHTVTECHELEVTSKDHLVQPSSIPCPRMPETILILRNA